MTLRHEGHMQRLVEPGMGPYEGWGVSIEGPKYCGKTWCAESMASSEYSLVYPAGDSQKPIDDVGGPDALVVAQA